MMPPSPPKIAEPCPYLVWLEAREAEHANLVGDMLPVFGGALLSEVSYQLLPHLDDAVGHTVHLYQPGGK